MADDAPLADQAAAEIAETTLDARAEGEATDRRADAAAAFAADEALAADACRAASRREIFVY